MPKIRVRDLDLYYEIHGHPEGEPLVLLHGFLSTGRIFTPFIDQLSKHYRVFILDWRGHGRTINPTDKIVHAELARDTTAFADALSLERAHFCGHSSGGMHLLFMALENPHLVHSLTLISATYTFDAYLKARVLEARDTDAAGWFNALNALHGEIHGPDYGQTLVDLWVNSVHRPDELPFTPDDLRNITCPTLILHGDRDRYFPVQVPVTMYRSIPNAELSILPNSGHLLLEESPEIFVSALTDFLSRNPL